MKKISLCLALLLGILLAPLLKAESMTIAAASSLRQVMDELVEQYARQHDEPLPAVVYGASGRLTTQILNGAPFDVFFSADMELPHKLYEQGMADKPPTAYARGRLVLWSTSVPARELSLNALADPAIRHIAIAQPAHAPYGERAVQALRQTGLWPQLKDKLVYGENVSHAAQMAASGAAEVGIIALPLVYFSDLAEYGYHLLDESLHAPLEQGFVVTRQGEDKPGVQDFARWLTGREARGILDKYGFQPAGPLQ